MKILLFGITKDIIGSGTLSIPTENAANKNLPQTVKELRAFLGETYPALNKLSSLAIAVNNNYAQEQQEINSQDEIALIPPVSGG